MLDASQCNPFPQLHFHVDMRFQLISQAHLRSVLCFRPQRFELTRETFIVWDVLVFCAVVRVVLPRTSHAQTCVSMGVDHACVLLQNFGSL